MPPAESWLWDPQNGNGFFNENSCHLFDAVCYLLGRPVSVMAQATNPMGAPSENAAAITVRFADGAIAALTVGGVGVGAVRQFPRIEVVTANGQARLSGREHIWDRLEWATRDDESVRTLLRPPEALGSTRYTHAFSALFPVPALRPASLGRPRGRRDRRWPWRWPSTSRRGRGQWSRFNRIDRICQD